MRTIRPLLATIWLLAAVFVMLLPTRIQASKASSSSSSSASTTSATPSLQSSLHHKQQTVHPHVVIYETEVLDSDDQQWKGAMPSRWTSSEGDQECPAPIHTEPPTEYTWEGEWKIVMSPQTDQLGWHLIGKTRRRRMWLRSIVPTTRQEETTVSTSTRKGKRQTSISSILTAIRDDWNFKGFGWSFYKSLIFLDSFGFSFRIPLSQNLDWWERHQLFPSISSSIGVYYPPTIAFFISISTNVDYLKWCLRRIHYEVRRTCQYLVAGILKTLLLMISLPLMILSKQQQQDYKWKQWLSSIPYSSNKDEAWLQVPYRNVEISERIGMSVSWRISKKRGYEFRISYWHSYLPTILYIHSLLPYLSQQKLPMEYWLRRKTSSMGLSTSGPTPSPPHFSCSACLSLSGFHYNSLLLSKRKDMEGETTIVMDKDKVKNKVSSKIKNIGKLQETSQDRKEAKGSNSGGIKQVAG